MSMQTRSHKPRSWSVSRVVNRRFPVVVLMLLCASPASAGGLWLNEFATPAMGRAGAGAETGTGDASAAFHNPATMTELDGQRILFGGQLVSSQIEFDIDRASPVNGSEDGGDQGGLIPAGGIYYAG